VHSLVDRLGLGPALVDVVVNECGDAGRLDPQQEASCRGAGGCACRLCGYGRTPRGNLLTPMCWSWTSPSPPGNCRAWQAQQVEVLGLLYKSRVRDFVHISNQHALPW